MLFTIGLRPFFLLAGIYAALAMPAWLIQLAGAPAAAGLLVPAASIPGLAWHAHEMLFGFIAAVIAGFLLTAVPNWTASRPLAGAPLAFLAALWLAGRIVFWVSAYLPPLVVTAIDLAFLPALAVALAGPLIRARALRNMVFLLLLAALAGADLLTHLEFLGLMADGAWRGDVLAIDLVVLLISIVGGRIVPAFTRNWLAAQGIDPAIRRRPAIGGLAIAATAAVLVGDQVPGAETAVAWLAAAAALLHLIRLSGWRGERVLGWPILWILHLGYLWLVVGFAVKAAALSTGALAETAALHAFTAGAFGSMTLGVMSRAALGHTGRALAVAPAITAAYLLVSLAAVLRVAGPALMPDALVPAMVVSGGLWTLAFALFAVVYWPILTRPPIDAAGTSA